MQWAFPTFRGFWRIIALCASSIPTLSTPSQAFKIDAHIYIAQEVLNDAADGTIAVDILNQKKELVRTHRLPINPRYLAAIRAYPEFYRMGSVGPDAFPTVDVGQLVIHPGISRGWGTGEWLHHLLQSPGLSNQQLAFVLGNLAHASADIFAHTYVNRYAGDIFDIQINETAARRHVMIESFISRLLPPIKVRGSRHEYKAHELVKDRNGKLAIVHQFLLDRMLFDASALDQTAKNSTTQYVKLIAVLATISMPCWRRKW